MDKKIVVIGGGSWGSALAKVLSDNKRDVTLYIRNNDQYQDIKATNINKKYLPGIDLTGIKYSNDLINSVRDSDYIVLSVPTNSVRKTLESIKAHIKGGAILINTAKGIEEGTLKRISEISAEILPQNPFVAFSGPTHAEEVGLELPTSIVAAAEDHSVAIQIQDLFMSDYFRVYTNDDLIGVELGGALKNIVALGAGILSGLGFQDNSLAAWMTRGISEIARLGIYSGASAETFLGLAGIGDLIVTCMSEHSRNRTCGYLIGQGHSVAEAIEKVGMVVEGIKTTNSAKTLYKDSGIQMPIIDALYDVIYNDLDPKDGVNRLMGRPPKHELEGLE